MFKLSLTKNQLSKLTEKQKQIVYIIDMKTNPLGNLEIFLKTQDRMFKYFLGLPNLCDKYDIMMIKNELQKFYDRKVNKNNKF